MTLVILPKVHFALKLGCIGCHITSQHNQNDFSFQNHSQKCRFFSANPEFIQVLALKSLQEKESIMSLKKG